MFNGSKSKKLIIINKKNNNHYNKTNTKNTSISTKIIPTEDKLNSLNRFCLNTIYGYFIVKSLLVAYKYFIILSSSYSFLFNKI